VRAGVFCVARPQNDVGPYFYVCCLSEDKARAAFSARPAYPHRLCFLEEKQVAHSPAADEN
jgi:hypothetical protein